MRRIFISMALLILISCSRDSSAIRLSSGPSYPVVKQPVLAVSSPIEFDPNDDRQNTLQAITDRLEKEKRIAQAAQSSRNQSAPRPRPNVVAVGGDIWGALARCESGGNTRSIGGGGRYFGAFQFTLGTWHSLGMPGNPIDYDYATQLGAAQRLVARSGWGQFPACARRLGLR